MSAEGLVSTIVLHLMVLQLLDDLDPLGPLDPEIVSLWMQRLPLLQP